VQQHTVWPLFI